MRDKCRWIPHPSSWTKLNFDGASKGNPGTIGIGCIINNDSGNWIAKRAKSIGSTTNNLAKLEALQEGLQNFLNLGISKLIIEEDSQIVFNAIRKKETPNWVLNSKVEKIPNLLDLFEAL